MTVVRGRSTSEEVVVSCIKRCLVIIIFFVIRICKRMILALKGYKIKVHFNFIYMHRVLTKVTKDGD